MKPSEANHFLGHKNMPDIISVYCNSADFSSDNFQQRAAPLIPCSGLLIAFVCLYCIFLVHEQCYHK